MHSLGVGGYSIEADEEFACDSLKLCEKEGREVIAIERFVGEKDEVKGCFRSKREKGVGSVEELCIKKMELFEAEGATEGIE